MTQTPKSAQLQIRVTVAQKSAIRRAAARAGMGMSDYVLSRVLSVPAAQFQNAVKDCGGPESRFALAELNALLARLSAGELREAVAEPATVSLTPFLANTIAAMVEFACARRAVAPPAWTRNIEPLDKPVFGSTLQGVRLHLLKSSPAPFRRRNLFIDATVGDRI
ncbi:MAG TPA: DUF1778 domain-containing protein [Steroidobacteraceae bacterium]|jgi:hypothetical protein|nr:DUF1778 domain-containing protein [Steroidobacteraceae bacterium]